MKLLLILSGEALELAKAEVESLLNVVGTILTGRLLILQKKITPKQFFSLAYTKRAYKLLFVCRGIGIEKKLKLFNWESIYQTNFCLRIHYLDKKYSFDEKKLAGYIWNRLKNPKVALNNSATLIEIFFVNEFVYCGLRIYIQIDSFENRKAHKRPALHPISLHPKLARCLVNLSGAKKGEFIVDPFCGTGGILIEAYLTGRRIIGYDIDSPILDKCKRNLDFFGIRNQKIINSDATKINRRYNYIVTDLPYGKSSKKVEILSLYGCFLHNLKKIIKKRAVVVFPDSVEYRILINKAGLKIVREFSYYIHSSLTKRIVVMENKN
ncbi:MAG: DNA methyltransferase [Nanoarchaeota archaeon]